MRRPCGAGGSQTLASQGLGLEGAVVVLETVQTFGFLVAVTDRASSRGAPAGWVGPGQSATFTLLSSVPCNWVSCEAGEGPGLPSTSLQNHSRLRPCRSAGPSRVRPLAVGVRYLSCATVTRRRRRLAGEHCGLGGGGEPEAGHDLVHGDGLGGCVELGQGRHVP